MGKIENSTVPLIVLVLELLVLAVVASRLGIRRTAAMTDRALTALIGSAKPKSGAD